MPKNKKISKVTKNTRTHKKNTRQHPKHFLKVYWPYIPIIAVVIAGMFFGGVTPESRQNNPATLAYATEMSTSQLLKSTNEQRLKNGLGALAINAALNESAQSKAENMSLNDYWSHNTPDGQEPWVFFDAAGYKYQKAGENLAYGFDTSTDTVIGWMNSKTHRENILDEMYTEVGFGFVKSENFVSTGQETVVVAHYARPIGVPSTTSVKPDTSTGRTLPASQDIVEDEPTPKPELIANERVNQPATSDALPTDTYASNNITRLQSLTNGRAPWSALALSLLSFAIVGVWLVKHAVLVKRYIRQGESFAAHHPLVDLAAVMVTAFAVYLSQSSGVVL